MSQPVSSNLGSFIQAAGTTVLSNEGRGNLVRTILPGTFVGSVEFYDSATAAGTTAGNLMFNIGLPLINQYKSVDIGLPFRRGLTVVATGTPTVAVVWDK